jgi:multidrug efflux pump subunit AcrA (membrane-fusion protein)
MRFRGDIEIERRENVVLLPIESVFQEEGSYVAFRRGISNWQRVELALGARNDDHVEVIDGLEPGDLVSLERRP